LRPVIGIIAAIDTDKNCNFLNLHYIRKVEQAGGLPLIIPFLEDTAGVLSVVDGLVLSGGDDIDAHRFGEDPLPQQRLVDPRRDRLDIILAKEALEKGIPLLAICRGLQVINVAAGGSLYQDLVRAGFKNLQHEQQAPRWATGHRVQVMASSLLHSLVKREQLMVNSFHHQGINCLGAGLRAVAYSPDGLVEAVEGLSGFTLGVQWHPETMADAASVFLFEGLIKAARKKKG